MHHFASLEAEITLREYTVNLKEKIKGNILLGQQYWQVLTNDRGYRKIRLVTELICQENTKRNAKRPRKNEKQLSMAPNFSVFPKKRRLFFNLSSQLVAWK